MAKTREPWLDIAKGVSIFSVVLFHAGTVSSPTTQAGKVWTLVDLGLFTFIMPLFFLVSGLFMGKSLTLPFGAFLKARVWPIAYLFLLWSLIFAGVHVVTGGAFGDPLTRSLALQTILWYLAAMVVHMVLAKLLMPVNTTVAITGAAIVALPFAIWFPFDGWGLSHTPHFFVFFLLACRVRDQIFRFVSKTQWFHFAGIIAAGAVLAAASKFVPGSSSIVYAIMPLVTVPLVLIASKWASRSAAITAPLSYLGRNTLPIFLIHPLALSGLAWVIKGLPLSGSAVSWALPLIVTAATVALCLIVWLALRRVPGLFQAPPLKA